MISGSPHQWFNPDPRFNPVCDGACFRDSNNILRFAVTDVAKVIRQRVMFLPSDAML